MTEHNAAAPVPPAGTAIHVSAPALIDLLIRGMAVYLVVATLVGFASADAARVLSGDPDRRFLLSIYALGGAASFAMAAVMWVAAPWIAGFVRRPGAETRSPLDITDGLALLIVWLGLERIIEGVFVLARAFVAWIRVGGFRATPEMLLPHDWFGDALLSASLALALGIALVSAAGPAARALSDRIRR